MSKASGAITEIKEFNGKNGGKMYTMTVNGTRYGTGRDNPGNTGDFVEFEVEQRGEFWNAKKVVNKGQQKAEVSAPKATGAKSDGMSKEEWAIKDKKIEWQSARRDAITLVGLLLNKDLVPLPKDEKKRIDAVTAAVDVLTGKFFEGNQTFGKAKPKTQEELEQEAYDDSPDDIPY